MVKVRPPKSNELQGVVEFLDQNLTGSRGWSILNEYPLAFHRNNLNNIRIITIDNEIAAHAVIKNLIVKTPMAIFKVAAIGSVVTAEKFRNQGLSHAVLKDCLEHAEKSDCDFAILWTDLYDFYRKLGFELAGSEIALILQNEMEVNNHGLKFLKSNKVDPSAIMKLYTKHSVGSVRTTNDIFSYLQIPNSQLYTAWDAHNNLKAYAVEGRGADLSDYIHEWGGSVSQLLPLFNEIIRAKERPITIISPRHSINLINQLSDNGAILNEGFLGMIKLINFKNLFFKIKRFARYMGQEDFVLEYNGQDFIVGHSGHIFQTNSEKDIVKLIFGPRKPSELAEFDIETKNVLEKILPVPMWIWGWDSV